MWNPLCTSLLPLLDKEERRRADRMARPSDRADFVVAHAALRDILGRRLGRSAVGLRFSLGRYGKPYLPDSGVSFSLSHTTGAALVAVAASGPVGADIERPPSGSPDAAALADRFFTPGEAQCLHDTPESTRQSRFLTYWTCKESFLKALGFGLAHPAGSLHRFEIHMTGGPRQAEVWSDGRRLGEWHIERLALPPPFTAAVTVRHPGPRIRTRIWDSSETRLDPSANTPDSRTPATYGGP